MESRGTSSKGILDIKKRRQKINDLSEKVNSWIFNKYNQVSSKDNIVVLLGGEHSIALSGFQAVAQKIKGRVWCFAD